MTLKINQGHQQMARFDRPRHLLLLVSFYSATPGLPYAVNKIY